MEACEGEVGMEIEGGRGREGEGLGFQGRKSFGKSRVSPPICPPNFSILSPRPLLSLSPFPLSLVQLFQNYRASRLEPETLKMRARVVGVQLLEHVRDLPT